MSTGGPTIPEHPTPTRNHAYRYLFHPKHHDPGRVADGQWLPEMTRDEEFAVFDLADDHDLLDEDGSLYGLRLSPAGEILALGTLEQQVAKFPWARPGERWHGYPLGPLVRPRGPSPSERVIPSEVLKQMAKRGLLDDDQLRRLRNGKPA